MSKKKKLDPETRQNIDKRTCRKKYSRQFKSVIRSFRSKYPPKELSQKNSLNLITREKFNIFIRKRPIFPHEIKKGEYDTVTCYPTRGKITVHLASMRADLKVANAYVDNITYKGFSGVFSEKTNNDEVYDRAMLVLIQHVLSGKKGVCFMYGQTGSGKTYTMTGILERISYNIFCWKQFMPNIKLCISAFEMSGDNTKDLLQKKNELKLRDDGTGKVVVCGISYHEAGTANDLIQLFQKALSKRTTHATEINSVSSRSHCFIQISMYDTTKKNKMEQALFGYQKKEETVNADNLFAQLTLVDLAGSERNADSMFHNAQRRRECAQINSSLMVLKDCLRLYHENQKNGTKHRLPYRNDKLTRILQECFTSKIVRTVIIATCSPNPTDTEHTINTLSQVVKMNKNGKTSNKIMNVKDIIDHQDEKVIKHPSKWSTIETKQWIMRVKGGKFAQYIENFPSQINGKQICRFTAKRFEQICDGSKRAGEALRNLLLKEMKFANKKKQSRAKSNRDLNRGVDY